MILGIESSYSFNGSLIKNDSIAKLNDFKYSALGLVDYSSAFFYDFYKQSKALGFKPILGLRVKGEAFDIILYPMNEKGYKELLHFASKDKKELLESENIIYTLEATYLESDDIENLIKAYKDLKLKNLKVTVGVDFSYYPCESFVYPMIKDQFPTIILKKVKYISDKERTSSLVLESILKKEKFNIEEEYTLSEMNDFSMPKKEDFLKQYSDYPDLVSRTEKFIDSINLEIKNDASIIKYQNKDGVDSSVYLKALATNGLKRRLEGTKKDAKVYKERLEYELSVIHQMGFDDYFLIVYDYVLYSKRSGIYVGPGRGSGASSLVAYSLGIVDIDPVEYNLYFERFLNPGRKSMPDIDTDIEDTRREDVIRYVIDKYGEDHVSLTCVYQTYKAKSVLQDIGVCLNIPDNKIEALSKEVPSENTIESLLSKKKIENYYKNDDEYKLILDIAKDLEGVITSQTIHPSGVIISSSDINDSCETHLGSNGFKITSYEAEVVESIGLLKMDFLSLPTLSFIHSIVDDIKKYRGIDVKLNELNLNDFETYKMIREKSLSGIFQLETTQMSELIKKMHASKFSDISICVALNRPGPKDSIESFLRRREKKEKIEYYDESIKSILEETLGIIVYQEQLMAIARTYAGFSLAEADDLRRGMSSKNKEVFESVRQRFYDGASKLNRPLLTTEKIFSDISKFAGYGLNKAHAVSYSYTPYYLSYLKTHYTQEFMLNMLKNSLSLKTIKECTSFNVKLNTPSILYSSSDFVIHNNEIYMPFSSIRGVGKEYAKTIVDVINKSDKTFEDFVSKGRELLPRSLIESLVYAGTFDNNGYTKKMMIDSLDGLYVFGSSLLGSYKVNRTEEYSFDTLKQKEYEVLGFNLNYHPLKSYKGELPKISDLLDDSLGIKIVALVSSFKEFKTKSGDTMLNLVLEDEYKSIRGVMFNSDYMKNKHLMEQGRLYVLIGSYKKDEDEFIIRKVEKI